MNPQKNSKSLVFTDFDSQILRKTVISENAPGAILKDFGCLLDFIESNKIEATKSKSYFSMKHLHSINERLSAPLKIGLNRPQQKAFANINGLYLLLRTMGIVKFHPTQKKDIFQLYEPIFQSWNELNNTERYFTLLESWLLRSNPRELLGAYPSVLLLKTCFEFWQEIPKNGLKVDGNDRAEEMIKYIPGFYNIALMELFGFIEIFHGDPKPGKGWRILKIKRKSFGDAIFKYLNQAVLSFNEHLYLIIDYEINKGYKPYGEWQSHFRPFFPEWCNNLAIPKPEYREGMYIFKVSLGEVWRQIAIYSDLTLEDLTDAILVSFDFDRDHLYSYYYKDLFGNMIEVNSPNSFDEPFTTDVLIGEISIHVGKSMKFLYDFGDNWEFQVTLEEIRQERKKLKYPKIIDEHGKAPDQYPDWDDEEWE